MTFEVAPGVVGGGLEVEELFAVSTQWVAAAGAGLLWMVSMGNGGEGD